ncbi:MAG TPA: ATP-binding protein [Candidatus Dormibacteraeota bacterium]
MAETGARALTPRGGPGPSDPVRPPVLRRQSSWARLTRGFAMVGTPAETPLALIMLLLLSIIVAVEQALQADAVVGTLDALIMLAAGWLLRVRWTVVIVIAALLSRLLSMWATGLPPATALTQALITVLAGVTAVTLSWAASAARRGSELDALYTFARGLAGRLQLTEVAEEVVLGAARVLDRPGPGWTSSIMRIEGDEAVSLAHVSDDADAPPPPPRCDLTAHPLLRAVAVEGRAVTAPVEELAMPEASRWTARQGATGTVALVPVHVSGERFGLLGVGVTGAPGFRRDDLRRLDAVAQLAGLAIANALRYDESRQTADRLAALERVKSDFLRLASHELRGPLGVLRGYISMMADGSLGDIDQINASAVIGGLQTKVDELARLIEQMLETARIEDDRLQLSLEVLDARDVAEEVVATMTPLAPGHSLELRGRHGLRFLGDRGRIATVLTNLVDNAIKYSPDGGEVRIACTSDDGWVHIDVADQGIGIAPEDQARLFTRFGRIVTPENGRIGGTGLGLWLSRELIARHGGTLQVRSLPRLGSIFTITLPAALAGAIAEAEEGPDPALERPTG